MNLKYRRLLRPLLFGLWLPWLMPCHADLPDISAPEILLLNSYHYGYRASDKMTAALYEKIFKIFPRACLRAEFLDSKRYPDDVTQQHLLEFLFQKYSAIDFDLIITCDDYAFQFVKTLQQSKWQNVPVVFCGLTQFQPVMLKERQNSTGIIEKTDIEGNIHLMQLLHPDADTLYIINDNTITGKTVQAGEDSLFDQLSGFQIIRLGGDAMSLDALLQRLESLSENALVLYQTWLRDRTGNIYTHQQVIPLISEHSSRPVYGFSEIFLGLGILGGRMASASKQAEVAADMVIRILKGESPRDLPVHTDGEHAYLFDYLQMKRFGISTKSLPEGSQLVNVPFSFYQTHKNVIIAALAVLVIQMILIIYLVMSRVWRRRIEKAFQQEHTMLISLMDNIPDFIYFKDKYSRFIGNNKAHLSLFGVKDQKETIGKTNFDFFPLDFAEDTLEDEKEIVRTGVPMINKIENISDMKGSPTWVLTTKVPVKDDTGEVTAIIGISRDITERMLSAERLQASLDEKELLLKEIHHRVKNNLQVISSLLNLQSTTIQDPTMLNVLRESQDRVRSMALIHENLYRSHDIAYLDVKDYIEVLVKGLKRSYQGSHAAIGFKVQVEDDIPLGIDLAVPCGLIINELISNALKHAFPQTLSRQNPCVILKMSLDQEKEVLLSVEDNGVGIPQEFNLDAVHSLGLKLVRILVKEQLEGKISFSRNQGTVIEIRFPLETDRSEQEK